MLLRWSPRLQAARLSRYTSKETQLGLQSKIFNATGINVHASPSPIQPKYPDPAIYNPKIIPPINQVPDVPKSLTQASTIPSHIHSPNALVTVYEFPSFEPLEIIQYPRTHLNLPLRRDILHKAVVYEGDKTRQGTAHTITRREAAGSGRKLSPQKGQGRARVGDRTSPVRSTGVKAHGPKHRDFSTGLPRKMYDLAWRTALSWRYRKGELVVIDSLASDQGADNSRMSIAKLVEAFNGTSTGSASNPRKGLRTLWIVKDHRNKYGSFKAAMELWYPQDVAKSVADVDCKNLLEGKRIVIEKAALENLLSRRQADLRKPIDIAARRATVAAGAERMAEAVAQTQAIQAALQEEAERERKSLEAEVATAASGEPLAIKEV